MPDIEIKARYANLEYGEKMALELHARSVGTENQIDTYFRVPEGSLGRLKLRESDLEKPRLIPYVRPNQKGPKLSDYLLLPVEKPEHLKDLLSRILGIETVVRKTRRIFLIENVRVHLDQVEKLGTFLEFEAVFEGDTDGIRANECDKVEELMRKFGVAEADLVEGSYREMMLLTTTQ
ncbi:MAG: class IV adenylate cyclase [Bdellovibrionota bacterium]